MSEEHNYETNVNLYKFLPRQRQLSGEERAEVEVMMKVNANKKMVQQHIREKTGKNVVLKDLHNIKTGMKKRKIPKGKGDIEIVDEILTKSNDGLVEYLTEDNELKALFYQDSNMRNTFTNYPEVMLVDATYKTNNLRMPLYVFLSIDGNGQSEIVALFLLTEEDEELLTSVVDVFKKHNPAWERVRVILTDKDMVERNVLTRAMPQASLQLCLFHVLKKFKREITPDKLGITIGDKIRAIEILQKLAYCKSKDEYTALYSNLCETSPNTITSYYNRCWHNIRTEWVDGLKDGVNLGNRTNNRLESINDKIKSVVNHYLTLPEFAENLLIAINFLRTERDHKVAKMFQKRPVSVLDKESAEYKYHEHLTPYACEQIFRQLSHRTNVSLTERENENSETWTCVSSEGIVTVNMTSCSCSFHKCMILPCRHIFKLREFQDVDLFSLEGISERWKIDTFRNSHSMFSCEPSDHLTASSTVVNSPRRERKLSQTEKYRQTHRISQQIASLASEVTGEQFNQRLSALKQLLNIWKEGKNALVIEVMDTDCETAASVTETATIPSVFTGNTSTDVERDTDIESCIVEQSEERDTFQKEHCSCWAIYHNQTFQELFCHQSLRNADDQRV